MSRIVAHWRAGLKNTKLEHICKFEPGDIFYCPTVMSPLIIKHWVETYGIPDFIVCDFAGHFLIDGLQIYTAPLRGLVFEFEKFEKINRFTLPQTADTDFCFNFCVNNTNKINQSFLLKLVEYFELNSFTYILNDPQKQHNASLLIKQWNHLNNNEFSTEFRNKILSPISIETRHTKNFQLDIEYDWVDNIDLNFYPTAVSLITEAWYESCSASNFSQRTLYAFMGLTFPIFLGGIGHVDYLRQMGFDMFDDIIDHSYQLYDTVLEQCYYAIKNNLNILTNLEMAKKLRQKNLPRLLNNRNLLYEGILSKHVYSVVDSWPDPLKTSIKPYWQFLQNYQTGKSMRIYSILP